MAERGLPGGGGACPVGLGLPVPGCLVPFGCLSPSGPFGCLSPRGGLPSASGGACPVREGACPVGPAVPVPLGLPRGGFPRGGACPVGAPVEVPVPWGLPVPFGCLSPSGHSLAQRCLSRWGSPVAVSPVAVPVPWGLQWRCLSRWGYGGARAAGPWRCLSPWAVLRGCLSLSRPRLPVPFDGFLSRSRRCLSRWPTLGAPGVPVPLGCRGVPVPLGCRPVGVPWQCLSRWGSFGCLSPSGRSLPFRAVPLGRTRAPRRRRYTAETVSSFDADARSWRAPSHEHPARGSAAYCP